MDNLVQMLVGDLVLSPELIFVARCIVLCLVVEGMTALLSAVIPLTKLH